MIGAYHKGGLFHFLRLVNYTAGNIWHFAFRWNGRRYRGSCKTSKEHEAKKVESLVLARLMEDGRVPGSRKILTLRDFSNRLATESTPAVRISGTRAAGRL